ncbi:MAG: hypothetical protein AB8G96_17155, partial [Phycisphaerales bacterium]
DASPPVFGDLNDDGIVDFVDLLFVMNLFGACPASGPCPADLDGNDSVDLGDVLLVLASWTG